MTDIEKISIPIIVPANEEKRIYSKFELLNDLLQTRGISFLIGPSRNQRYQGRTCHVLEVIIKWDILNRSAGRRKRDLGITLKETTQMLDNGFTISQISKDLGISTSSLYRRIQEARQQVSTGEDESEIYI